MNAPAKVVAVTQPAKVEVKCVVCLGALMLLCASTAQGQERPHLVVITSTADASTGARLAAELRTLGLPVEMLHGPEAQLSDSTLATVTLDTASASARLCVRERTSAPLQCEDILEPDVDVLLIRLVEGVRARVEVRHEAELDVPQAEVPQACPAPEPLPPPTPSTPQWTLRLGVHGTAPIDAFDASLALAPSLAWQVHPLFSLHLEGALSVVGARHGEDVGEVQIAYQSLMLGAALHMPSAWLQGHELRLQLHAGAAHLDVHADARAPALGRSTDFTALRLGAQLAATFWLDGTRIGLGFGVEAGALLPPRVLVLAGLETAPWGTPWLAGEAHVAVRLD